LFEISSTCLSSFSSQLFLLPVGTSVTISEDRYQAQPGVDWICAQLAHKFSARFLHSLVWRANIESLWYTAKTVICETAAYRFIIPRYTLRNQGRSGREHVARAWLLQFYAGGAGVDCLGAEIPSC
jgi:hypothetical protein